MSARRPLRLLQVSLLAAALAVTTACAPSSPGPAVPDPEPSAPSEPTTPATPSPDATVGFSPEDLTCETMLDPDLVSELEGRGWTAREDPFFITDVELPEGLSCTWGDFTSETGDNLLLFAWSPITEDEAATARSTLAAEGWITEEGDDGTYVTEDPEQAIVVDDEGYGMTYLFGDGWVTLSDTRQGLVLIERPTL